MTKIVYCIAGTRHAGGMERVLANKANWLVRHGYEVVIVTTDQCGEQPFFPLDERIACYDLGIGYEESNGRSLLYKAVRYPFKLWRHERRLAQLLRRERADVVVSMFCNDVGFVTRIKDGSKKVLETHFSRFKRLQYGRKGLWHYVDVWRSRKDLKVVKSFDRFVVLTEADKRDWGCLGNSLVIPNASVNGAPQRARLDTRNVVAIGRYCYQKSFDRLIEAWSLIAARHSDWRLSIVGDGEERERLQTLIAAKRLNRSVSLVAPTKAVEAVYLGAALLVSSSRYEGLPMVMIEAQAYGIPIVAFDCKCGPRDVISHGETGFLVPAGDIKELAEKMACLMDNDSLRREMGRKAAVAAQRYSEERVMRVWTALFSSLVEE